MSSASSKKRRFRRDILLYIGSILVCSIIGFWLVIPAYFENKQSIEAQKGLQEQEQTKILGGDSWWDTNWDYYRTITIDSDYIDTDLVNFPVLVNSTDTALIAKCDGGNSVRFLAGHNSGGTENQTEFNYEIEEWTTGGFSIWVNVSLIHNDVDTQFLLYYGNSGASDNQDHENVWDSNYKAVYHMNDSTTSTIIDSTIYGNDGAKKGANTPILNSSGGKIGTCQNFYDTDYINIGHDASLSADAFTISCWINGDTFDGVYGYIMSDRLDANNYSTFKISASVYGVDNYGRCNGTLWLSYGDTPVVTTNNWYFISSRIGSGSAYPYTCVNTTESTAGTETAGDVINRINHGNDIIIGYAAGWKFDGDIDELRISNIERNVSWLNASFHSQNQSNHLGNFLVWGSEQTSVSSTSFSSALSSDPLYFNSTIATNYNINASGQTSNICAVNITNDGNIPINITIKLNDTIGNNIYLKWNSTFYPPSYTSGSGGEHTNWYTMGMNQTRQGRTTTLYEPINNSILWTAQIGGSYDIYQGPVINNGTVYFTGKKHSNYPGCNNTVALYLNNGTEIWNVTTGATDETPTFYNENLYVQNTYNSSDTPYLWCLHASNGTTKWKFSTPYDPDQYDGGTPAIAEDLGLVITVCGGKAYGVYLDNGTEKWSRTIVDLSNSLAEIGSSPTYFKYNVFIPYQNSSLSGGFVCLNATTGSIVWWNSSWQTWDSSPVMAYVNDTDVMYLGGAYIHRVGAFNITNGYDYWKWYTGESFYTNPVYDNETNTVFVGGTYNKLYALNASLGAMSDATRKRWEFSTGDDIYSSPAIAGDYLYFGSLDNNVYCLNKSTGAEVWRINRGDDVYSQPAIADGILVIADDDYNLTAIGNLTEYNLTGGSYLCYNETTTTNSTITTDLAVGNSVCVYLWSDFDGATSEGDINRLLNITSSAGTGYSASNSYEDVSLVFNYTEVAEEVRSPLQVFNHWFSCGNGTIRNPTEVFDYWFQCGNVSVRNPTQVFNNWFSCGNITNNPPVFSNPNPANNSNWAIVNPTVWNITIEDPEGDDFNWTFDIDNCSWHSANYESNGSKSTYLDSAPLNSTWMVFVNASDANGSGLWTRETFYFTVRPIPYDIDPFTSSAINSTQINLTWIPGGTIETNTVYIRYRTGDEYPTDITNGTFLVNTSENEYSHTSLIPGTKYSYKAWPYNVSANVFGNASVTNATTEEAPTLRQPFEVFNHWFQCGNGSVRSPIEVFDYWFLCGNYTTRNPTIVSDNWFQCGNVSAERSPVEVFDYWFQCGNETIRSPFEVFDYWFSCGNVTIPPRSPTQIFNNWFLCGNGTVRSPNEVFDYWFSCGNITIQHITITNIYPVNNSENIPVQPVLVVNISHIDGESMNVSWYYGYSIGNENILLNIDTGVVTGTVTELFYLAVNYSTSYYYKVVVTDGENISSDSFMFTTKITESSFIIPVTGIIAAVFGILALIGVIFLLVRDKIKTQGSIENGNHKKRDNNNNNFYDEGGYSGF